MKIEMIACLAIKTEIILSIFMVCSLSFGILSDISLMIYLRQTFFNCSLDFPDAVHGLFL